MPTGSDLVEKVRSVFNEPVAGFLSDDEIMSYLNAGLRYVSPRLPLDLAERTGCFAQNSTTVALSGGESSLDLGALNNSMMNIKTIETTDTPPQRVTVIPEDLRHKVLQDDPYYAPTTTNPFCWFSNESTNLKLFCRPVSITSLRVNYNSIAELTYSGEIKIPNHVLETLVDFAYFKCLLKDERPDEAWKVYGFVKSNIKDLNKLFSSESDYA